MLSDTSLTLNLRTLGSIHSGKVFQSRFVQGASDYSSMSVPNSAPSGSSCAMRSDHSACSAFWKCFLGSSTPEPRDTTPTWYSSAVRRPLRILFSKRRFHLDHWLSTVALVLRQESPLSIYGRQPVPSCSPLSQLLQSCAAILASLGVVSDPSCLESILGPIESTGVGFFVIIQRVGTLSQACHPAFSLTTGGAFDQRMASGQSPDVHWFCLVGRQLGLDKQ